MKKQVVIFSLITLMVGTALAQDPNRRVPRPEDHFWRKKIVNRIDLTEKMNAPLIARENRFYAESQYSGKEGIVMALFNGLKQGDYVAYNPDSLKVSMSYQDVLRKIQDFEGSLLGEEESFDEEEESGFDEGFDEGDFDDFSGEDDMFAEDDFGDFEDEFGDDLGDDLGEEAGTDGEDLGEFDPLPFENVIHFVEDVIFDKTRSEVVHNIEFIEIIWTDPGETLPDKPLCVFRYEDIVQTLEGTQWKNRFNDAEYRTLKEIFDLRLFHSFIIEVSGVGVTTLDEAEVRRQQLTEFEHHLWSY